MISIKRYAFNGMILLIVLFTNLLIAQTSEFKTDEVVVTAGRTPISFSDLNRNVVVIKPSEIKNAAVNSIQDLLQFSAGIDLKTRGVDGVQSDIAIRGGTFEQTLVLVDGIKMSDPQTAHHNLNLPVSLDNVERIEILKGQGSRIHGPNAFSGVINIITKKGSERNFSFKATGGQHGYFDNSLNASLPLGIFNNRISISRQKSDGYRDNTDFEILNFSYSSSLATKLGAINLFFGYNDKDFGANSFYTTRFPNQGEKTRTKFLNVSGDFGSDKFSITPKIYWRRNDDDFVLRRENPSFYHNVHKTNVYGGEIQSTLKSDYGTTAIGLEISKDEIESNNLGEHTRSKKGFFVEHSFSPIEKLSINLGGFAFDYSDIGLKIWPGLDLGYQLNEDIRIFGSFGRAFRIPSFTELFYNDPVTIGNADLKHEETTNFELGLKYNTSKTNFNITLFRKEGKDIIDWVRTSGDKPWSVRNIAEVNTNGIELSFAILPKSISNNLPINKVQFSYTYLDSDKKTSSLDSRYVLDHLQNQFVINIDNDLFAGVGQSWIFKYEDRLNFEDSFIVDTQINKDFDFVNVFVKATNIFNNYYEDIAGVPLPGRWVSGGVKLTIN